MVTWFWIMTLYLFYQASCESSYKGVDIGNSCQNDIECTLGNGSEYSKCNRDLMICICTINHLGEDQCLSDSEEFYGVCRRRELFKTLKRCNLECSPKGVRIWKENEDWNGEIVQPFSPTILDKKVTFVELCQIVYIRRTNESYFLFGGIDIEAMFFKTNDSLENDTLFEVLHEEFEAFFRQKSNSYVCDTSVCFDPKRALNTVPDGFEVRQSSIPNSGLGVFTNVYIEANTILSVFKGQFDPEVDDFSSVYSWTIFPTNGGPVYWTDGTDLALSNWLRYVNTPISAAMENIISIEFQEHIYYVAFRDIQPGSELLIWYGDTYAGYLRLKLFRHPIYHRAMPGYVGGECELDGEPCEHDINTVCASAFCLCRSGFRQREMLCVPDEKLGGFCYGSNGDSCELDKHAECQRGICICKNHSVPTNGKCIPDETFGGRCVGRNGQKCLLANNTECSNGVCKCVYGTSAVEGVCIGDETLNGKCSGNNGVVCQLDKNAECRDSVCVCTESAIPRDGKCIKDVPQKSLKSKT